MSRPPLGVSDLTILVLDCVNADRTGHSAQDSTPAAKPSTL